MPALDGQGRSVCQVEAGGWSFLVNTCTHNLFEGLKTSNTGQIFCPECGQQGGLEDPLPIDLEVDGKIVPLAKEMALNPFPAILKVRLKPKKPLMARWRTECSPPGVFHLYSQTGEPEEHFLLRPDDPLDFCLERRLDRWAPDEAEVNLSLEFPGDTTRIEKILTVRGTLAPGSPIVVCAPSDMDMGTRHLGSSRSFSLPLGHVLNLCDKTVYVQAQARPREVKVLHRLNPGNDYRRVPTGGVALKGPQSVRFCVQSSPGVQGRISVDLEARLEHSRQSIRKTVCLDVKSDQAGPGLAYVGMDPGSQSSKMAILTGPAPEAVVFDQNAGRPVDRYCLSSDTWILLSARSQNWTAVFGQGQPPVGGPGDVTIHIPSLKRLLVMWDSIRGADAPELVTQEAARSIEIRGAKEWRPLLEGRDSRIEVTTPESTIWLVPLNEVVKAWIRHVYNQGIQAHQRDLGRLGLDSRLDRGKVHLTLTYPEGITLYRKILEAACEMLAADGLFQDFELISEATAALNFVRSRSAAGDRAAISEGRVLCIDVGYSTTDWSLGDLRRDRNTGRWRCASLGPRFLRACEVAGRSLDESVWRLLGLPELSANHRVLSSRQQTDLSQMRARLLNALEKAKIELSEAPGDDFLAQVAHIRVDLENKVRGAQANLNDPAAVAAENLESLECFHKLIHGLREALVGNRQYYDPAADVIRIGSSDYRDSVFGDLEAMRPTCLDLIQEARNIPPRHVFLLGGGGQSPAVREWVRKEFGQDPDVLDPGEVFTAVAIGACHHAAPPDHGELPFCLGLRHSEGLEASGDGGMGTDAPVDWLWEVDEANPAIMWPSSPQARDLAFKPEDMAPFLIEVVAWQDSRPLQTVGVIQCSLPNEHPVEDLLTLTAEIRDGDPRRPLEITIYGRYQGAQPVVVGKC